MYPEPTSSSCASTRRAGLCAPCASLVDVSHPEGHGGIVQRSQSQSSTSVCEMRAWASVWIATLLVLLIHAFGAPGQASEEQAEAVRPLLTSHHPVACARIVSCSMAVACDARSAAVALAWTPGARVQLPELGVDHQTGQPVRVGGGKVVLNDLGPTIGACLARCSARSARV